VELKGKRAVVVGLGITGRATAVFVKKQGCNIVVSERKARENLSCAVAEIEAGGIPVEVGGHRETTFCEADLIVVSPGVPLHLDPIQRALKEGTQVMSEIELASRFVDVPIVAVTGTNGKSTTVSLLAEIFQSSGKNTFLGGNIGLPLIEYPLSHREAEVVIIELSSFQLEGIDEFRPQTSVLLNISEDHLDRYPAFQDYVEAKARIFKNQKPQDHAILNREDASTTHHLPGRRQGGNLPAYGNPPTGGSQPREHDGCCSRRPPDGVPARECPVGP
jgi:UDP-N-acetylmuramoylalanine--D-glutamate ligase